MKLTQEQQQETLKKLEDFFQAPCKCSGGSWILSDTIFELREFNKGNIVLGGPASSVFPVITASCNNCGNTHFFSAILLGIIEK